MVRFKTNSNGNEVYHIVATRSLDVIQDHWIKTNTILGIMIRKSYKTLNGASKAVKDKLEVAIGSPSK